MDRANGIRKSNFTASTSVPADSATFDFVYQSTNYKITYGNFLAGLGVTGSIVASSANGVAVLDKAGTVNTIRNIVAGNGLVATINGTNDIALSSGLQQDSVGLSIIDNLNTATPKAVSLSAGTGIEFNKSNGNITLTATGATADTKRITIRQASDFPAAVAGVITLNADTEYFLDGDIDVGSDRFVMGSNTIIKGYGTTLSTITSTTSGDLFTASGSFRMIDFAVNAASARVFNCSGGSFQDAYLNKFTINSCTTIGAFANWYSLFWDQGAAVSFTNPISFSGACTINIINSVSFITGYTTAIDLGTATFNALIISRCGFNYASATNHVNIAANSANVNAGRKARLLFNNFTAGATNIVNGYDAGDVSWDSLGNLNLANTSKDLQASMQTSNTTTISGGSGDAGNPIRINGGTDWVIATNNQFTGTTDGRFTYNGTEDNKFAVTIGVSGTASASNANFAFYIAVNGTIVSASKTEREFNSGNKGSPTPANGIVTLSTGDYVELYIENQTNTQNFDCNLINCVIVEG